MLSKNLENNWWLMIMLGENRLVNFLGFSSFAQNQNFSQKFWAKTQNLPKLQMYEFLT